MQRSVTLFNLRMMTKNTLQVSRDVVLCCRRCDTIFMGVIPLNSKIDVLKENGSYNENSASVQAEHFKHGIFFDPHDLVQVKYEMVRSVEKDNASIGEAASMYGFSRQTFYTCRTAIEQEGIGGLIPRKKGPKTGYKLDEDGKHFIDQYMERHPHAKPQEINQALEKELGLHIHNRTIIRYLTKKA